MPSPEEVPVDPRITELTEAVEGVSAQTREWFADEVDMSLRYGGPVRPYREEVTVLRGVVMAVQVYHPLGGKRMGDY